MAVLTPIDTLLDSGDSIADLNAALVAATEVANTFYNDGNLILVVYNGDASGKTVTIESQPDPYGRGGGTTGDLTISVAAGDYALVGLLNPAMWNIGGICQVTLSAITSVSLGLIRLRKVR